MVKAGKRILSAVLFWGLFFVMFAYAQNVVIPKQFSNDPNKIFNSLITPYTNAIRTRAFEELPGGSVDVAILGSSTVFCNINPVQLYRDHGLAVQEFAVGAMTGALTDYISDIVFETQSPRYVLLDATRLYADFMTTSVNYLVPYTKLTPAKIKLALSAPSLTAGIDYLVPLLNCHQNWANIDASDFTYIFAAHEDPLLGMIGMTDPATDAQALAARFEKPAMDYADFTPEVHPVLTPLSKQQILDFRDKCISHGAQAVLIVSPTVFGNECTQFMLVLQAFAEENGIPMVNFNLHRNGLVLTAEDFANDHHLTLSGMEKFTRVLGRYLTDTFAMPDRRGDPAYARYEESVRVYEDGLARLALRKGEAK